MYNKNVVIISNGGFLLKKRKLFITAGAVTASLVAVTGVSANTGFTDVKETNSHYENILALQEAGIIKGYSDGTFKPGQAVTRGQAAKMLVGAFKLEKGTASSPFTDVAASNEYHDAIQTLASQGIIKGYSDGTFKPNQAITRGQFSKMLTKILDLTGEGTVPFKDISTGHEYYNSIVALYENGLTKGTSATTYSPYSNVTRGQFASFVVRGLDWAEKNTQPPTTTPEEEAFDLSILHVNDTHAHVEAFPQLMTAVKEERAQHENSLLLHAGDAFSGTLYFNEFLGKADLEFMNAMGFDAMTFGNHEFDLGGSEDGHKALTEFIKGAKFPLITANIDFSKDPLFNGLFSDSYAVSTEYGKIYNGIIKEIDGEKVGIFGLTTEETKDLAFVGSVAFENYIEEANKAVAALEAQGVNKIIALTHIGYNDNPKVDNDILLAKNVEGIDVIVGGHSHDKLDKPFVVDTNTVGAAKDTTLIVQANEYGKFLGTVDVTFDKNGVVTKYDGQLIEIAKVAADEAGLKMLESFKKQVEEVSNKEIGVELKTALENPRGSEENPFSVRANETILGNLITDGMRAKAQKYTDKKVVMALQNGGGIRSEIPAGNVTVGQVITVLPFGNTLALMDATGAELKAAFEVSVKNAPEENGGFLHVSGGRVTYDSSKPTGQRVVSIEILNEDGTYTALEDSKTYTIATNAFTAKGGDGFDMFKAAYAEGRVTDLGLSDWENFQEHLTSGITIPTETEGRIVDVAAK
nr:5'-nucleotidase C-terminal domain-containing protein [Lysinibacillus odysseyi]